MDRQILEYLSKQIQEERSRIIEDLGDGTAKDHGEYRYACGIVRGLLMANNLLVELAERMEKADE